MPAILATACCLTTCTPCHLQGESGWQEKYHVDSTWVNVHLVDANDNSPVFIEDQAHLVLAEDTPRGTHLVTFTAHDIDGVREREEVNTF